MTQYGVREPGRRPGPSIQLQVLAAAQRLCAAREGGTFTPDDVVRALPHLNARSVRTHVASRCCVDAPSHHAHRWPYFRRVRRGVYRIEPEFRRPAAVRESTPATRVAEAAPVYAAKPVAVQSTVHAVVTESEGAYVAECLEVAVLTQGRSLDEVVANLHEALALHLEGEDPAEFGLTCAPKLAVSYETAPVKL